VTTTQDRLSTLGDQLLTERQQGLVRTAVDAGYYNTPRECTLTELAERLGIAKSTRSGALHRAEGAVIKRFLADGPLDGDAAG
jgi:predicted DNA binding protein